LIVPSDEEWKKLAGAVASGRGEREPHLEAKLNPSLDWVKLPGA
jgi:hypothetical protein